MGSLVLVALDWWRYHLAGVASSAEGRALLLRVGVALGLALALKLALTRRWSVQDVGIAWVLVGVAGLAIRLMARWGPQPASEWERDLIQSALDVGSVVLLIGLLALTLARLTSWWRDRRDA